MVFTFGSDALWYSRAGGERKTHRPYHVDVVDSTGAGDAFRGGIAFGISQGFSDEQTVDFASAVAACVCRTVPHALNAPSLEAVSIFIEEHRDAARDDADST